MTAHHRDDQVETLLIRLAQGSGLIGLAGIPMIRPFGPGVLIRPLLSLSRKQLKQVLVARKLKHITDPSNQDSSYLRNYVRLQFLPALSRIAPKVRDQLLQLSKVATNHVFRAGQLGRTSTCIRHGFCEFAPTDTLIAWQVRFFAQAHGLHAPSALQIAEFVRQCVDAANDRCPEVPFGPDICIRKWRDKIHWIDFNILGEEAESEIARTEKIYPNQSLELRFPNGVLSLNTREILEEVSVFFGVTHRRFRLGRKRPLKSIKQLAQTLESLLGSENGHH